MDKSWLINSMTNEICENFLLYKTAKEMWDAVKETYSTKENTAEQVDIVNVLHDLRQGDLTLTNYYNILGRHWQQLDVYEEYDWNCPEDAAKYQKIVEKRQLFKFLLGGLNKDLDEIRGRILGTKALPTIREAFTEVKREESRKKLMLGKQTAVAITESSALATGVSPVTMEEINGNKREDLGVTIAKTWSYKGYMLGYLW